MEAFTPRNVLKYVATAAIHATVQDHAADAIADHTRFEDDDTVVNISSHVIAWYVSHKVKPITDAGVDTVADYVNKKREARKARRKEDTNTEK